METIIRVLKTCQCGHPSMKVHRTINHMGIEGSKISMKYNHKLFSKQNLIEFRLPNTSSCTFCFG